MKLRSKAPCVQAELDREQGDEAAKVDKVLRGVELGVGLVLEEGDGAHDHDVRVLVGTSMQSDSYLKKESRCMIVTRSSSHVVKIL